VNPGDWSTGALLAEAGRAWVAISEAAAGLPATTVTGQAGNGAVTAAVDGHGTLVEVRVSERSRRYADADRLAGQLLAAIRDAEREAARHRAEALGGAVFAGRPVSELRIPTPAEISARYG
jgi:DNA-binding protein YbaB